MSYHGKEVEVILTGEAKDFFKLLNDKVTEEIISGKTKSFNQTLIDSIREKIVLLKNDPSYGIQIPKDRIPKEYIQEYSIDNLWKINLSGYWRMIYTIKGKDIEIIALIMDIFNHKKYNKKFKYRKK